MTPGCQLLSAVIAEAARNPQRLSHDLSVPVLLVVNADLDDEGVTAVTSPGRQRFTGRQASSYVVPLVPRFAKPPDDPRLSFGRATVCDVMLPFSAISKHHGYFVPLPQGWHVVDVGSTNGTNVDGVLLQKGALHLLKDGDILRFGQVTARFLSGASFAQVLKQGGAP